MAYVHYIILLTQRKSYSIIKLKLMKGWKDAQLFLLKLRVGMLLDRRGDPSVLMAFPAGRRTLKIQLFDEFAVRSVFLQQIFIFGGNFMSQINITKLTFAYEGSYDHIFENVSFALDTDWKLGFIGRNGRGKTTFLRLLQGLYEYGGSISASVTFDYFPFEVANPEQSAVDIVLAKAQGCELWRLNRELGLLGVDSDVLYRPFNTLSGGERTKVLLAALFLRENNFLLIDEPTNHLDMEGRQVVSRYLNEKNGFILVSHDREFLDGCINHVLSINKAGIELQRGNFSSWRQNKENADNLELTENERLKREIGRLSEAVERTKNWSDALEKTKHGVRIAGLRPDRGHIGAKAAKMMKRSKATENRRQKAIDEKSSLLKNIESKESLSISPLKYHCARLINIADLSAGYGSKSVLGNVTFSVKGADRIALLGKNGSGKSTLLKLILGEEISHTGRIEVGSNLIISYVPQDTSHLAGSLKDYALEKGVDESLFKAILRKLDFSRVQFEKDMRDFSAGQKKKVVIAESLCCKAHLYIWDEPLNYIDVLSRIQIENLILEHNPTMIFVEHDAAFIKSVATDILYL